MNQHDLEVALRNLINAQAKRIKELEALESKQYRKLSDEEIKEVWFSLERELNTTIKYGLKLARAIEERHGIK